MAVEVERRAVGCQAQHSNQYLPKFYLPSMYQVVHRVEETDQTVTLGLRPKTPAHQLTPSKPGQFTMVTVFGYGEIPVSIARDECGILEHTIHAVGSVSKAFCRLSVGSTIGLRGPFGRGWPSISADVNQVWMIAGGLGLAALRSSILAFAGGVRSQWQGPTKNQDFPVMNQPLLAQNITVTVLIGARSARLIPYRSELERLAPVFRKDGGDLRCAVLETEGCGGYTEGLVTELLPTYLNDPWGVLVLCCGPEVIMRAVAERFLALGAAGSDIYISLERSMKCGFGACGHCQLDGYMLCRDGPVFSWTEVSDLLSVPEL